MSVNSNSVLCSCIYCKEVKSAKGIFTHVDRTHLNLTKYSSGYNGKYKELAERHRLKIDEYLLNSAECVQCKSKLDYSKRHNKFCSTSCAATYNNALKDYSTFKPGPAKSKQLLNKSCAHCGNLFDTYKKNKKFCCRKCAIDYKNAPLRANRTEWQNYRADCQFRFSINDYPTEFEFGLIEQHGWYKASNRGNNLNGVSRDHMVSCRYGFDNNLPVEHLRHPANCKLIIHNDNASKHKKNSISYEELLERIKVWDEKYQTK
jgi:hypothetical protein